MSGEMTIAELLAGSKDIEAQYEYAYKMQEDLKARRQKLEADETVFKNLITCLSVSNSDVFAVTDLKPRRVPNLDWIKSNMPAVYDELIRVSDSDCGRIMAECYTRQEINEYLRSQNAALWESKADIRIGDFDKAVGGKNAAKQYEGTAYNTEWTAGTKTELILKHPDRHPELTEGAAE